MIKIFLFWSKEKRQKSGHMVSNIERLLMHPIYLAFLPHSKYWSGWNMLRIILKFCLIHFYISSLNTGQEHTGIQ